jgi:mRNA interferase MazF
MERVGPASDREHADEAPGEEAPDDEERIHEASVHGAAPQNIVKQYEIWWVALPEPVGRRPVLLLSRDSAYAVLNRVLVAEITTRIRGIPQEVRVGTREGLPVASVANFDNLRAVPISALSDRAGKLAGRRVAELKTALGHALGWPELTLLED